MDDGQKEIKFLVLYYGKDLKKDDMIKKALDKVSDLDDKITLLQWSSHTEEAKDLIERLNINNEKFIKLKKENDKLEETINLKVLSNKYEFLDDILKVITADIDFQQKLISLDDRKLSILKRLCERVDSKYLLMFTECFLNNMGVSPFENSVLRYDDLNNDLPSNLSDEDIDVLIFLYSSKASFDVKSYIDLKKIEDGSFWMEKFRKDRRGLLLARCGFDLKSALNFIKRYDISNVHLPNDVLNIYNYIVKVLYCDENELENIGLINENFENLYMFEKNLKNCFLNDINNSLKNGYYLVSVLGAYDEDREISNYKDLWTRANISPFISCSLIRADNLATAPVKSVILGFKQMNYNLLNMSEQDINSSVSKNDLNEVSDIPGKFRCSSNLICETRSDYNELVFERYNGDCKVMPDYILWFKDNKEGYDEAVKAALDFQVPLVTIDPYEIGKMESLKIDLMLENIKNDNLCLKIIMEFFNNRNGLALHNDVLEEFFSEQRLDEIIEKLKDIYPDNLKKVLDLELNKMKSCMINQNFLNDSDIIYSKFNKKIK